MVEVDLTADDAIEVRRMARDLARRYGTSDDGALLGELEQLTGELPRAMVEAVTAYRDEPGSDLLLVRNHRVSERDLGDTPSHWKQETATRTSLEYEMLVMLYGALLGSVFGWATQQDGHLVNDIVPMASQAAQQVGASSKVELAWHTEDAFHPGRADYLCLFCLRNPTDAPTTVASLADIQADATLPDELFEPCVRIAADDAQLAGAAVAELDGWDASRVEPVPILRNGGAELRMCVDPAYMTVAEDRAEVYDAVTGFCHAIDDHITELVLSPGDLLVLDNHRVVHGRRPFKPTFSGKDRWLKRVNVATDFGSRRDYCADQDLRLLA